MTQEEIKQLRKGDVICYPHPERNYIVYGIIEDDGSIYCSDIMGDGDSNIGEADFFVESEPGWLENYSTVHKASGEVSRLFKILVEHHGIRSYWEGRELQKENDIEIACCWLKDNAIKYVGKDGITNWVQVYVDFRKYMEERL